MKPLSFSYVLPTMNFDVYTDHIVGTKTSDGSNYTVNYANLANVGFTQAGDGAVGNVTIHMVTADDTLTQMGDGYQWNWGAGQQGLGFAIEDSASGYWVTMLSPDGSSTQQFIGGKGDM